MARVGGGLRQASDFFHQLFPADFSRFVDFFPFHQFGDRRSASHRWNATFRAKTNVRNALAFSLSAFEAKCELENIAADRVLQARAAIRSVNFTGVARMLEMV